MITPRGVSLACLLTFMLFASACGDSESTGFGGSSGVGGVGGAEGGPDAFTRCTDLPNGCDDANDCTVDGNCESITGMCIGREPEPRDTPCGPDGIFVCDGEGACVGCNTDEQCDAFFPDEDCRVAPSCVAHVCPLPGALRNGTPCSTGECRDGECTSPWAPKRQLLPMVCGVSYGDVIFQAFMTLTVSPTPIAPEEPFSASIEAAVRLPRKLLQLVVIVQYPDPLETLVLTAARAEIRSSGVVSGTSVETTLNPLPQQIAIPQVPNFGDGGGQACDVSADCPLAAFGQKCDAGVCRCACSSGCVPDECPNLVTSDVVLTMETIQGAIYRPISEGSVCFDVAGDYVSPSFSDPVRTGARITTGPIPFGIECASGFVEDNGTVDPSDDVISPNPVEDQICFPIGDP